MSNKYQELFKPFKIGNLEIKNKIAMAPMLTTGYFDEYGVIRDEAIDLYEERAKGGVGLIFTFGVTPDTNLENNFINKSPFAAPEVFKRQMSKLADRLHKHDTKLFVQVWFGVGRAMYPAALETGIPIAPSKCRNRWAPDVECRELSKEEIQIFIDKTVEAAILCKESGCDGIDINGAYGGYIGDQFTVDAYNQRTDEYGGSLDNKIRLHTEVIKKVKEACGKDFPVTIRYGVKHYAKGEGQGAVPGEEFVEFGRDYEESIEMAKKLEAAGYDGFLLGNGCFDAMYWQYPPMYHKDGVWLDDSKILKDAVNVPVICPGKITSPDMAEQALVDGKADAIGVGRALLADANWANKAYEGNVEDIRPCIGCNNGCVGRANNAKDIRCAVNANLKTDKLNPIENKKKVCIIGGGVAGMEAARIATLRGHEVTLYEKNNELGGALIPASIPDYKDADRRLIKWFKLQLEKLNIDVKLNTEVRLEMLESNGYDEIIVATGASEKNIPVEGSNLPHVVTAIDALMDKKEIKDNVVVIGGGQVGCETALWLKEKGKNVTVVEALPMLMSAGEEPVPTPNMLMLIDQMVYNGVNLMTNTKVNSITETEVNVEVNGEIKVIKADSVVVSIGYKSNNNLFETLKEKFGEHVWLAGDANKPTNILYAVEDGYTIANKI